MISDEKYLVFLLEGYRLGLSGNYFCWKEKNDGSFDYNKGHADALYQDLGAIDALFRLYNLKRSGKIPQELLDVAERYEDTHDL